jgi:hypothetical protein
MKIFLIVIACIIGWFVCAVLSALIGKKLFDFEEEMVVFCAVLAPLVLALELITIPFAFLGYVVSVIIYGKEHKEQTK